MFALRNIRFLPSHYFGTHCLRRRGIGHSYINIFSVTRPNGPKSGQSIFLLAFLRYFAIKRTLQWHQKCAASTPRAHVTDFEIDFEIRLNQTNILFSIKTSPKYSIKYTRRFPVLQTIPS